MKRILPIVITFLALAFLTLGLLIQPRMGEITESWEATNQTFKVRIDRHAEVGGFGPVSGAYYVFRSAPPGSDAWREIMTFRHDDPIPIPRDHVRFVNDRVGYIFMGWMYAVTTDGGATWSVWDAESSLAHWECCPYGLIENVRLAPDSTGTMILGPDARRRFRVSELHTSDFGRNWAP